MSLPRLHRRRIQHHDGDQDPQLRPLPDLSLEELVPQDNFYRRLDARLDLSFVRDLVEDRYACSGRPSVDPVVFFRLRLVMFFEGISALSGGSWSSRPTA